MKNKVPSNSLYIYLVLHKTPYSFNKLRVLCETYNQEYKILYDIMLTMAARFAPLEYIQVQNSEMKNRCFYVWGVTNRKNPVPIAC